MKFEKESSAAFPQADDARALTGANRRRSSDSDDVALAPHLTAHIGRTLRRMYEPQLEDAMPSEIDRLMEKLDAIPPRSEQGS